MIILWHDARLALPQSLCSTVSVMTSMFGREGEGGNMLGGEAGEVGVAGGSLGKGAEGYCDMG